MSRHITHSRLRLRICFLSWLEYLLTTSTFAPSFLALFVLEKPLVVGASHTVRMHLRDLSMALVSLTSKQNDGQAFGPEPMAKKKFCLTAWFVTWSVPRNQVAAPISLYTKFRSIARRLISSTRRNTIHSDGSTSDT